MGVRISRLSTVHVNMKSSPKSIGCSPRGALVVLGGVLIHLSLGSFYTFGKY